MSKVKTTHIRLPQPALDALEAARKSGYTKSGFTAAAIVEKAERDGIVKRKQYKESEHAYK